MKKWFTVFLTRLLALMAQAQTQKNNKRLDGHIDQLRCDRFTCRQHQV